MIFFICLIVPTLARLDLVSECPVLTWTQKDWDTPVRRGNEWTHAGVEAQGDWLITMAMLYSPFLILATIVSLR